MAARPLCLRQLQSLVSRRSRWARGDAVIWSSGRGPDVVCTCCNFGWAIDQEWLGEPASNDNLSGALADGGELNAPNSERSLAERQPSVEAVASAGQLPTGTRIRKRVKTELKYSDGTLSVVSILGQNVIDPKHAEFVESVTNGKDDSEPESFRRASLSPERRLEVIIDHDGKEHPPGGGGVDMALLKLPVQRVLQGTRPQYTLQKDEM